MQISAFILRGRAWLAVSLILSSPLLPLAHAISMGHRRQWQYMEVYGESGRYPLSVTVKGRMVRFWADLVTSPNSKYSCKLYNLLRTLDSASSFHTPWLESIKQMLNDAGLECVWDTQCFSSKTSLCRLVSNHLCDMYELEWRKQLEDSSKCLLYRHFKDDIRQESFLKSLPEVYSLALLKFRCSNHKLPTEQGRKNGTPRELRLCRACDMGEIGDEFHLIFECPAWQTERDRFIPMKFRKIKSTYNLCRLLGTKSKKIALSLAKFLKSCGAV